MRTAAAIALALLAAAPAVAGTWDVRDGETVRRQDNYDKAMDDGDQAAIIAAGGATSPKRLKQLVASAVRSYERAAEARPDAAEPHWRAANVLYGFYLDCDDPFAAPLCLGDTVDAKLYRRIIAHWDAFEKNAPLDPRIDDILFDRAILHTKLATDRDIARAIDDYVAILDRQLSVDSAVVGNLAESYMMLGDLDAAIERYQEAVSAHGETSTLYGLAIAYDRDGQGKKAREIIDALGPDAFESWVERVEKGDIFYVPDGEVFYYYAVAYEALGRDAEAIKSWKRYLEKGAHPRFHPRARDNLHALTQRAKRN
jgi:tetratricopeptide (TPR) repeat protein